MTTQPVSVPLVTDSTVEPTETFTLTLSTPTNATIADGTGVATLTNDDMALPVSATAMFQVSAPSNDVNQDGGTLTADGSTVWLGTGSSTTASFAGLRFAAVTIPRNATITSARLEVRSAGPQRGAIAFDLGIEASGNSAPFSAASPPATRALLAPRVTHASDTRWSNRTWYLPRGSDTAYPGARGTSRLESGQRPVPRPAGHGPGAHQEEYRLLRGFINAGASPGRDLHHALSARHRRSRRRLRSSARAVG